MMDRSALLDVALVALSNAQLRATSSVCQRGEFPMTVWCPEARTDFNYLSGYALFHAAVTLDVCADFLQPQEKVLLRELLACGKELPAAYQGPTGYNNWYRPTPTGERAPRDYVWPEGLVLSIRDDLDDTAISVLLCLLGECRSRVPYTTEQFARYVTKPAVALRDSSRERQALAGVTSDIYMSWSFDAVEEAQGRLWVPFENSVELITVSHVYTAVHRLGGGRANPQAQRASAAFVNALLRPTIAALLDGDTVPLEKAARYYPRVPFAPLSFVLRCHVLSDRALLDHVSLDLISRALREVGPLVATRDNPVAAPLFWLLTAGYALQLGLLQPHELQQAPNSVLDGLAANGVDARLGAEDFVFFQDAHIGHYGGRPYANAVLLEASALARLHGFA